MNACIIQFVIRAYNVKRCWVRISGWESIHAVWWIRFVELSVPHRLVILFVLCIVCMELVRQHGWLLPVCLLGVCTCLNQNNQWCTCLHFSNLINGIYIIILIRLNLTPFINIFVLLKSAKINYEVFISTNIIKPNIYMKNIYDWTRLEILFIN